MVEISDTSLSEDRHQAAIYAAGGVPVYWIVNLVDRQVEVYSDPSPSGYRFRQDYHAGESIPTDIGGNQLSSIALNDILP